LPTFTYEFETNIKLRAMREKLETELKELTEALQNKLITVSEYQDFYYHISQKIKALK
jgi:hypothetical protein